MEEKNNSKLLEKIQKYMKHQGLSFELTLSTGEKVDISHNRILKGNTLWKLDAPSGKKAIDLRIVTKAVIYAM